MMQWPEWLNEKERERILQASAEIKNGSVVIAAMMYLGMKPTEAVNIRYYTACGDAAEMRKIFLHIPNEYRRHALVDVTSFKLTDRLTDCTGKEAEKIAERVFQKAGLETKDCLLRLRRTAARLHYVNGWTPEDQIKKWFTDVQGLPEQEAYYKG